MDLIVGMFMNELVTLGYFYVCTKPNTVYAPL